MKKIYTKNNYLIIEWSGMKLMRPKKNIFFFKTRTNDYYLLRDSLQSIPSDLEYSIWSDYSNINGLPFASMEDFDNFVTLNTGNYQDLVNSGINPQDYDLSQFVNQSNNPFVQQNSITNLVNQSQLNTQLNTKQDKLTSGTNIKTINNNSILGSGNIIINSPPTQFGTAYTKEFNGSVTTSVNVAVFNISSSGFSSISQISISTELIGSNVNNGPIGVITARSLTSITVSLYESKNTGVIIGGVIEGLEDHAVANTIVYLSVKGN